MTELIFITNHMICAYAYPLHASAQHKALIPLCTSMAERCVAMPEAVSNRIFHDLSVQIYDVPITRGNRKRDHISFDVSVGM